MCCLLERMGKFMINQARNKKKRKKTLPASAPSETPQQHLFNAILRLRGRTNLPGPVALNPILQRGSCYIQFISSPSACLSHPSVGNRSIYHPPPLTRECPFQFGETHQRNNILDTDSIVCLLFVWSIRWGCPVCVCVFVPYTPMRLRFASLDSDCM